MWARGSGCDCGAGEGGASLALHSNAVRCEEGYVGTVTIVVRSIRVAE